MEWSKAWPSALGADTKLGSVLGKQHASYIILTRTMGLFYINDEDKREGNKELCGGKHSSLHRSFQRCRTEIMLQRKGLGGDMAQLSVLWLNILIYVKLRQTKYKPDYYKVWLLCKMIIQEKRKAMICKSQNIFFSFLFKIHIRPKTANVRNYTFYCLRRGTWQPVRLHGNVGHKKSTKERQSLCRNYAQTVKVFQNTLPRCKIVKTLNNQPSTAHVIKSSGESADFSVHEEHSWIPV